MQIAITESCPAYVEMLVLPYDKEDLSPWFSKEDVCIDAQLLTLMQEDLCRDEMVSSYISKGAVKRVLLLLLAKDRELRRKSFAKVARLCKEQHIKHVTVLGSKNLSQERVIDMVDGFCMANYAYTRLKAKSLEEKPISLIESLTICSVEKKWQSLIDAHQTVITGVNLARDLVNGNADEIHADALVEVAHRLAKSSSHLHLTILRKKELEAEKMGLMLAVNKAATREPACIVMEYQGDPSSKETIAIIGKGVTFDTGGLNLKPTGSMETMKTDMAGAAAVLGTIQVLQALGIKKNVIGVVASVENAVGHGAYKPGDVYMSHAGISVEIANTDAEGRLILADALSYVQKHYKPSCMIDLATLTGGIVVAIGEEASGLFATTDELADRLQQAAKVTGERVWRMPLFPEYQEQILSKIADIRNAGIARRASPCIGAAFLQRFVSKETPWAHLDIAGTAYLSEETAYHPSFATGVGVKLLIAFLQGR